MLTANLRGQISILWIAQPNGWPDWFYFRFWDGTYGHVGRGYNPQGVLLRGYSDAGANAGPLDLSSENDFVGGVGYFYNGTRRDRVANDQNPDYTQNVFMLILGSGTSEPKKTDYKLESWIPTSRLSYVGNMLGSAVNNNDNPKEPFEYIGNMSYTYKNVSSDPITVSEIGLIQAGGCSSRANNDAPWVTNKLLLARNVLSSPVTIAPGELYTFTMVFK